MKRQNQPIPGPIEYRNGIPVFLATAEGHWKYPRRPDGTRPPDGCHLIFTCPKCRTVISHGGQYGLPGAADGHRCAHCTCWERGYYVQEVQAQELTKAATNNKAL